MSVYPPSPPSSPLPSGSEGIPDQATILQSVPPPRAPSKALIVPGFDWSKTMQHSLEALYASTPGILKPGAFIIALMQTLFSWVSNSRGKFVDKDVLANQVQSFSQAVFAKYPDLRDTTTGKLVNRKITNLSEEIGKKKVITKQQAKKMLRKTTEELKEVFRQEEFAPQHEELQSALIETRNFLAAQIEKPDIYEAKDPAEHRMGVIRFTERKLVQLLKKKGFSEEQIAKLQLTTTFDQWKSAIDNWGSEHKTAVPSKKEVVEMFAGFATQLTNHAAEVLQTEDPQKLHDIQRVFETALTNVPLFQVQDIEEKRDFVSFLQKQFETEDRKLQNISAERLLSFSEALYANADFISVLERRGDKCVSELDSRLTSAKEIQNALSTLNTEALKEHLKTFLDDEQIEQIFSEKRTPEEIKMQIENVLETSIDQLIRSLEQDKTNVTAILSKENIAKEMVDFSNLLTPVGEILLPYTSHENLSESDKLRVLEALTSEAQREIDDFVETNKHCLPIELREQLPSLSKKIQERIKAAKKELNETGKPPEPNILELFDQDQTSQVLDTIINALIKKKLPDNEYLNFFTTARAVRDILQSYDIAYSDSSFFSNPISKEQIMYTINKLHENIRRTKWELRLIDLALQTPAESTMSEIIENTEQEPLSDTDF